MRLHTLALALLAPAALLPLSASASPIANPSFETLGGPIDLDGWTGAGSGPFEIDRVLSPVNGLPTDGTYSGRIFKPGSEGVAAGDARSVSQVVDLTGVSAITFDASLDQYAGTEQDDWSSVLEAGFLVNGVYVWTAYDDGAYLDQTVDVSIWSGPTTIEFRLKALVAADLAGVSDWFQFDNLRVTSVPEPSTWLLLATAMAGLATTRRRRGTPS